jgi:hypothetical protein
MDTRQRPSLLAVALLAAASTSAQVDPPLSPEPSTHPSLSGSWRLNPDKSDDPLQKIQEAAQSASSGGRGGFGGGGMGGRRGGYGGRGGGEGRSGGRGEGSSERMRAMTAALEAPRELTITQTEAEITVLEAGEGRLRTLHPDGKNHKNGGDNTETRTRWDKDRLVVDTNARTPPPSPRRSGWRPTGAN